jgi:general secretion pathway protein I
MNRATEAGFTVLEIAVALAILALGLTALFRAVDTATRTGALASRQREAVEAAQSLLAGLEKADSLADGKTEGRLPNGQRWRLEATPLAVDRSGPPAPAAGHLIDLTISWQEEDQLRSVVFHTLLLGPAS